MTPTLAVNPPNQNVTSSAGNTAFTVTSNTNWTVTSDASWCTVTTNGTGSGTIVADYSANTTSQQRVANISVTVASLPVATVTVTQSKSAIGIDEISGNELRIYPNPNQGIFRLVPPSGDVNTMDVRVTDMDGKVVFDKQFSGAKEYGIDLSAASPGTYEVMARTDNAVVVKKLVIIR